VHVADDALELMARLANGDARSALNILESAAHVALATAPVGTAAAIDTPLVLDAAQRTAPRYDKAGEAHYDIVSAYIKSMRGSDPDAALYWLVRMLEGGEDPVFIARRLVIFASEDVGLADPFALVRAMAAAQAVQFVGLPEAGLTLSHATIDMALAPKSNAATEALSRAKRDLREVEAGPPPLSIRNAPTGLMKDLGYGCGYLYPHEAQSGVVAQAYLPEGFSQASRQLPYYRPSPREEAFRERLEEIRRLKNGAEIPMNRPRSESRPELLS
jgi:putative ATPase